MTKSVKHHGRVYTPSYLVSDILDFGNYFGPKILQKHVIDNSCGNGAFLVEIVNRYCSEFLQTSQQIEQLKTQLESYIHGIELDKKEHDDCVKNLQEIAAQYNLSNIKWDILCADTLTINTYQGKMDYVFGNPPYVRVHNLDEKFEIVKKFHFAQNGMTDLYIVFFEIGFNMLSPNGEMCIITPSSWLNSKAGKVLRNYIINKNLLTGLVDLEHFQPFNATTYTLISRFEKNNNAKFIDYCNYDAEKHKVNSLSKLSIQEIIIDNNFYIAETSLLKDLRNIKSYNKRKYVLVKNGFATLSDSIFIGDFTFSAGTIDIIKASTGTWYKCIFPYNEDGRPMSENIYKQNKEAYSYLLNHKQKLSKGRDIENEKYWYLFGRTQALKDVSKNKYAINTIIKDIASIKLNYVSSGKGIYSGLYILTDIDFKTIKDIIYSDDFLSYVSILKNYKSGGYFTFTSKDLEQYLNFKLSEKYGQSRISQSDNLLF